MHTLAHARPVRFSVQCKMKIRMKLFLIIYALRHDLPVRTIGGNNPGRSFDGVKIMPFHQVSFKMLAFNSLLGGGSYKQFPSAAT